MDINDLKYFSRVYENENLTKAAKELFITQQALSRIIANLEEEVGVPLFKRNSRGVTPTEFGKYFYSKAADLINKYDDFTGDIYNKIIIDKKKLKIGFSPGTLQIIGVKEVLEHSREYLQIDVDVSEFSDVDCEKNVSNGSLDLALTVNPKNEIGFSYYNLIKDNFVAVVNKNIPIADKISLNFSDLKDEELILLDDSFRMQLTVMEHFEKAGFKPNIYSRCSHDLDIAYEFVSLNKGIFIFVDSITHIQDYQKIVCVPINVPTAFWDVGFLLKKGVKISQEVKTFINYFLKKYNKSIIE